MSTPMIIEESNLSVAWGKAFLAVLQANEIAPLVVVIKDLSSGDPPEVPAIRESLDQALATEDLRSCHTVANTIFPCNMWNSEAERHQLFERYDAILPRVRRHNGNRYGLYFQRFIAYGHDKHGKDGVNQLEHIIQTWCAGKARRAALQAAVFDPRVDHTKQRQRGFPCLQQVAFAGDGAGGLSLTGFYATQYVFERAYGNYLGLYHLGRFMAHEMGLTLSQVTCIATPAVRGPIPKYKHKLLAQSVSTTLDRL